MVLSELECDSLFFLAAYALKPSLLGDRVFLYVCDSAQVLLSLRAYEVEANQSGDNDSPVLASVHEQQHLFYLASTCSAALMDFDLTNDNNVSQTAQTLLAEP